MNLWLLQVLALLAAPVGGQRFMRQGFSNQEDFGAEMSLEDAEGAVDMTRELFLLQDLPVTLPPPDLSKLDRATRAHLKQYLKHPVSLKLFKKRGKFGLRAVGTTPHSKKKIRAFWRAAPKTQPKVDFMKQRYEEAVQSRLVTVELELQLPPMSPSQSHILPSVIYQLSVEPGSMNPKALVPRCAGPCRILPQGREGPSIDVGHYHVSICSLKNGPIDGYWARGRPIFRAGRKSGLM